MSSSKNIIKARDVAVTPRGKSGGESFVPGDWEFLDGATAPTADGGRPPGAADDSESAQREAYECGYREGKAAAEREKGQAAGPVVKALENVARQCRLLREEWNQSLEDRIVTLALAVAEKVIRREVSLKPEALRSSLREILRDIKDKTELTLIVSPDVEAVLRNHPFGDGDIEAMVKVLPDPSLKPGDVIVETQGLVIDARISEQLEILQDAFSAGKALSEP